jgi:hypothetical protein
MASHWKAFIASKRLSLLPIVHPKSRLLIPPPSATALFCCDHMWQHEQPIMTTSLDSLVM